MTYDGAVTVGGPAQVRQLQGLSITKVAVGSFDNNAYLLRCTSTGSQLLIDAAAEAPRLLELCQGRLDAVVTTHQHQDHWGALAEVVASTGAPVAIGEPDADGITVAVADRLLDGSTVRVGDSVLQVRRLTGHTPGGVALVHHDPDGVHVFTGDSLFPGGVGRTTSPEEFATLLAEVTEKLFDELPDETWVYPGHGADTTLGAQRPHLGEWRARGW
jgi:glyoxylase-like metal-dependent hydrolase (beta-lactamase superfamily II)